ncbi:MAG TPA: hypothetical protein VE954_27530 [Oligoflexus sp.]|uniref:hypothetical protein n=1 Tax=Oligoflexus sp. TaxID=1971216 RepID=UPI002D678E8A|nr:hypothetical protein [Oligoflexus sp.]HYX36877.1 hypothetical protein [Oligoflexus sp.]
MKFKLCIILAMAFNGCKAGSTVEGENSGLSTVTVSKFLQKQGTKAWSSMKITVSNGVGGTIALSKKAAAADFASGSNSVDLKLKYGSYKFVLEYLDADGKTLLYRSCQNEQKQDPVFPVNEPKVPLKLDICPLSLAGAQGDPAGTIGEADVSIQPVLKDEPAAAAGPVAGKFLAVDAVNSLDCKSIAGARFGDPAVKKSSICIVNSSLIPESGFYLKGSIRVAATGKMTRLTMVGFGLKDASGTLTNKTWVARDAEVLNVNELVPVELGKDSCLAGKATGAQVGNINVFVEAAGNITLAQFIPNSFTKVSCK